MATTTSSLVALSHHHHAALCPPPLHIQKKPQRSSYHRQLLRKYSPDQRYGEEMLGPLDDIIDEIAGDIWSSLPVFTFDPSMLEWPNPRKASTTWTVIPLPVSRIPSDVPLTVRKQRNSRSTASGSSYNDVMLPSHDTDQNQPSGFTGVSSFSSISDSPWSLFGSAVSQMGVHGEPESSLKSVSDDQLPTIQRVKDLFRKNQDSAPSKARNQSPSRLRRLTNALPPRLRRGTSSGSPNNGTASNNNLLTNATPTSQENVDDNFRGWIARNASRASVHAEFASFVSPPPNDRRQKSSGTRTVSEPNNLPTTVKAVIRILPEVKILTEEEHQDFWVAIEIEGVLHNCRALQEPSLDVVILIDNGYYVSKDCLDQAVDVAVGTLNILNDSDRVSLYATHCTHEIVSGNVPELLYPLRVFSKESKEELREMILSIRHHGTQKWSPPRPNPPMTDVLIAVANSLENRNSRKDRTHIVLLSPASSNIHGVAKSHPRLYIHQVNPAVIPITCNQNPEIAMCNEECCANFAVHNWAHYQSISSLVKQIIRYARSEIPLDKATDVHVAIRTRDGCTIVNEEGNKITRRLRPGQVHSLFVHIRVDRSQTREFNVDTRDPVLQTCLNKNNMRQDLQIATTRGAFKAHLLDVQILYQSSLDSEASWRYDEAQLLVFKDLGNLARPSDVTVDLYKRLFFYMMSRCDTSEAEVEIMKLADRLGTMDPLVRRIVERLQKEIGYHKEVLEYEQNLRQNLPYCHGSIHIPDPHEWVIARWNLVRGREQQTVITT